MFNEIIDARHYYDYLKYNSVEQLQSLDNNYFLDYLWNNNFFNINKIGHWGNVTKNDILDLKVFNEGFLEFKIDKNKWIGNNGKLQTDISPIFKCKINNLMSQTLIIKNNIITPQWQDGPTYLDKFLNDMENKTNAFVFLYKI